MHSLKFQIVQKGIKKKKKDSMILESHSKGNFSRFFQLFFYVTVFFNNTSPA